MTNIARTSLILASLCINVPAFAAHSARFPVANADQYKAIVSGADFNTRPVQSGGGMRACAMDDGPSDSIAFKRADGRCSGE